MATTEFNFVEHIIALAFEEGLIEAPADLLAFLAQRYEGLQARAVPWPRGLPIFSGRAWHQSCCCSAHFSQGRRRRWTANFPCSARP